MTHQSSDNYVKKYRAMRAFGVVAVLIVLAVFGGYIYVQSQATMNDTSSADSQAIIDRGAPDPGSDYQKPDSDAATRSMSSKNYLNSDGSVNTSAVDNLLSKISKSSYKDSFLQELSDTFDSDYASGTITAEQRDALREAFGVN